MKYKDYNAAPGVPRDADAEQVKKAYRELARQYQNVEALEVAWLNTSEAVTAVELSRLSGLSSPELEELIEYGALVPLDRADPGWRMFSAACVAPLRKAAGLRRDFDLDIFVVGMLVDYLRRIEDLQVDLRSLRARVPGPHGSHHEGPDSWYESHG